MRFLDDDIAKRPQSFGQASGVNGAELDSDLPAFQLFAQVAVGHAIEPDLSRSGRWLWPKQIARVST